MENLPGLQVADVLERIFPAMPESGLLQGEAAVLVGQVLATLRNTNRRIEISYELVNIEKGGKDVNIVGPNTHTFHFLNHDDGKRNSVTANVGHFSPKVPGNILQAPIINLVTRMVQSTTCMETTFV